MVVPKKYHLLFKFMAGNGNEKFNFHFNYLFIPPKSCDVMAIILIPIKNQATTVR